jgi:hypothetical protein
VLYVCLAFVTPRHCKISQSHSCCCGKVGAHEHVTEIPFVLLQRRAFAHVVVDHIKGDTLAECWSQLSWWSRLSAVWMLRGYISQLRQLQRSIPGPAVRTPSDGHFFTEYGAGPFNSYEEMIDWFNHKLDVAQKSRKPPEMHRAGTARGHWCSCTTI